MALRRKDLIHLRDVRAELDELLLEELDDTVHNIFELRLTLGYLVALLLNIRTQLGSHKVRVDLFVALYQT
jgi:hypothetical protein